MSGPDGRDTGRRARPCRPGAESLEGRALLSGLAFRFEIDDPAGAFAAHPGLAATLDAAGAHLGRYVEGQGVLEVAVSPVREPGSMLARNRFVSGSTTVTSTVTNPDGSTSTTTVDTRPTFRGFAIDPNAPLEEARTGVDPNGAEPDLRIEVNLANLDRAWFDPSGPERSAAVPADRIDFQGVVIHELLHGLGINGSLTPAREIASALPGSVPIVVPGRMSGFTRWTTQGEAGLSDAEMAGTPNLFLGPTAQRVHGGPVPIFGDGHVGSQADGRSPADLMNPATTPGVRFPLSDLDLAILADLGWQVRSYPGFPPPDLGGGASTISAPASVGVARVDAEGSPRGSTTLLVRLTGPVDPASASDLGRYALEAAARRRGRGVPGVERIPLASAAYDPATATVRVQLTRPLAPGKAATLKVDLDGLRDPAGRPLPDGPDSFQAVVRGVRGGSRRRGPRR